MNTGALCLVTVAGSQFQLKSSQSQWSLSPLTDSPVAPVDKRPVLLLSTLDGANKGDLKLSWARWYMGTIIHRAKKTRKSKKRILQSFHQLIYTEKLVKRKKSRICCTGLCILMVLHTDAFSSRLSQVSTTTLVIAVQAVPLTENKADSLPLK